MTAEKALSSGQIRHAKGKPVRNEILLSLPEGEFRPVSEALEHVNLSRHQSLHKPIDELEFVYFPNSGLISLVVTTEDGKMVEVGVVGKEGVIGTPLVVGLRRSPLREVVQIPSEGFRIKAAALQAILATTPALQTTLSRYAVIQSMQVSQTSACNRLHDLPQRLARWLLTAMDRVDSDALPVTHDYLATMLGTDRPSVTLAAGILQKKKAIEYARGTVKILNRNTLESSACECYKIIQRLYDDLGSP